MADKYQLYIDTCQGCHASLLDAKYSIMSSHEELGKASFLQKAIAELLAESHLEFSDISQVIYAGGPGSYTGMRITEGFIGIIDLLGIKTQGFYHYELPRFLGRKNFLWISTAFKGEFFVHDGNNHQLVSSEKLSEILANHKGELWSYNEESFFDRETLSSYNYIKSHSHILQNASGYKKPYYYRPLEEEFTKKKK